MTTGDFDNTPPSGKDLDNLEANLARVEYTAATTAYFTEMMQNPAKLLEGQLGFWSKSVKHYVEAQHLFAQGKIQPPSDDTPKDRRFAHEMWDTNPYFNFIKQQYLMNAAAITDAVAALDTLEPGEKKRLEYFSQQIVDMFSPTNFLATNPEALALAAETEGESLVKGLENLVADLEANNGDLVVTLADKSAFKVGENLATTPGSVVFRNHMFELIQYAPTTENVHTTPLVILNPDASYRDTGLVDYIEDGYLTAFAKIKEICGVKKVNAVGYCIAGTTLSLTLALMKQRGDTSVNAATLFTTLTDFSDRGEVGVFLDNDFVDGIEAQVNEDGVLDSFYMSRTFSFLLPAKMSVEYLRGLCQDDRFASDGFEIAGTTLHVSDVTVPICAIACEADHIAAWKSSYRGVQKMGSKDKTFILSESGHIAGIINPPTKNKYGHYTNPDQGLSPEDWQEGADKHEGSWWPRWGAWLAKKSGKKIPARTPENALEAAPGHYVLPKN